MIAALGAWNIGLIGQLSTAQQEQAAVDRVLAIAQEPGGQAAIRARDRRDRRDRRAGGPGRRRARRIVCPGPPRAPRDKRLAGLRGLGHRSVGQPRAGRLVLPWASSGIGALAAAQVPIGAGLTVGLTREARSGVTTPTLPMVVSGVTTQGS